MIGLWKPVTRVTKLENKGCEERASHDSCGHFLLNEIEDVASEDMLCGV